MRRTVLALPTMSAVDARIVMAATYALPRATAARWVQSSVTAREAEEAPKVPEDAMGAQPKPLKEAAQEAGVQVQFGDPLGSRPEADAEVIELADRIARLNLVQVVMLSERLKDVLGIDTDMIMSMGGGGGGGGGGGAPAAAAAEEAEEAAPVEEKTAFDVMLKAFDAKAKIKIIKEVRAITGLGLKEAKELVESAPVAVKKGIKKEEAETLMATLKELGAEIDLE